mmetsp:Transcript_34622/g.83648  ORF Transcript_34622/g.83648 Transcript_34622/m.83648 type:complete len:80 (+) Transcript_34622:788-1027(+)
MMGAIENTAVVTEIELGNIYSNTPYTQYRTAHRNFLLPLILMLALVKKFQSCQGPMILSSLFDVPFPQRNRELPGVVRG